MNSRTTKAGKRGVRHARIRAKVIGTAERPRLSIFKSNTTLYAQLIDDSKSTTIAASSTKGMKGKDGYEVAKKVGAAIAEAAKAKGIKAVVFDRGGFKFTGRVAALAEGAREAGLSL